MSLFFLFLAAVSMIRLLMSFLQFNLGIWVFANVIYTPFLRNLHPPISSPIETMTLL